MNKRYLLLFISFAIAISSCKNGALPSAERIIGSWEVIKIKITSNKNKPDEAVSIEADAHNFEDRMKEKPYHIHFNPDSTFITNYFHPTGRIIRNLEGRWWVNQDTMFLENQTDQHDVVKYLLKFAGERVVFTCYLDFDEDGIADDYYYADHKRID